MFFLDKLGPERPWYWESLPKHEEKQKKSLVKNKKKSLCILLYFAYSLSDAFPTSFSDCTGHLYVFPQAQPIYSAAIFAGAFYWVWQLL